jgi:hypothetical protein
MRCVASDVRIHQAQVNVHRATTVQVTTGGDTGHRNRWSTAVTSVKPATSGINNGTTTTSCKGIQVEGDNHSQPVRKSPRLHEKDDDEVVKVPPPPPPPPKIYTVVDLTEEGTETTSTMELNAPTQLQTSIRRRGRPRKARPQSQAAKNSTNKPSQNA